METWRGLLDIYVTNASHVRAVSYLAILLFFALWGAYALYHKLYHRGAIKLLFALVMFSSVIRYVTGDERWVLWLTTPAFAALAVTCTVFLLRLYFAKAPQ